MAKAAWIAADWGTSRLRLWALNAAGEVIAAASSDQGMGGLQPDGFEAVLLEQAAPFLAEGQTTQVLICGMAGARQGWIEAPYATVPCAPAMGLPVKAPTKDKRLSVHILPGLCQSNPADVMRGEETQIAGVLARDPAYEGTLCLPGTHAKWVQISGGQVVGFNTMMTGELFALLSDQSILRHSLTAQWDDAAFGAALDAALAKPETVFAQLFALRAGSLVEGQSQTAPRAHLSGMLIGAELAAMRDHWQDKSVTVIGAPELTRHYVTALQRLGADIKAMDGAQLALDGLRAAFRKIEVIH